MQTHQLSCYFVCWIPKYVNSFGLVLSCTSPTDAETLRGHIHMYVQHVNLNTHTHTHTHTHTRFSAEHTCSKAAHSDSDVSNAVTSGLSSAAIVAHSSLFVCSSASFALIQGTQRDRPRRPYMFSILSHGWINSSPSNTHSVTHTNAHTNTHLGLRRSSADCVM